jgi:hypothetical protein
VFGCQRLLLIVVIVIIVINFCAGYNPDVLGPRKRGRKPASEPYIDTRTTEERTAAWRMARAVVFRFRVNQHTAVFARQHITQAGVIVSHPVFQLVPYGRQVSQFVTLDAPSLHACYKEVVGVHLQQPPADETVANWGKLGVFCIAAGWRRVKFKGNMSNRQARNEVGPPKAIRTDGYRLQVSGLSLLVTFVMKWHSLN